MRGRRALEALGLLAVLAFVGCMAYLPHTDTAGQSAEGPAMLRLAQAYWSWGVTGTADDYEYTVHVDENVHWVAMAATERADSLRHEELFFGIPHDQTLLSLRSLVHERGFHTSVLMFQQLTGLDWLSLFRFLPAVWMTILAFALWAALRPWPGGLVVAALVALTPTSARFLGPGFLVPIGFGLAWIAATMLLLPEAARRGRGMGLLVLVVAWAFFIHLIAGVAALLGLLGALPFLRSGRKGLALLIGAALLPVIWMSQAFASDVEQEVNKFSGLPVDLTILDQLGIPFLVLWVLGCGLLVLRPPRAARLPILAAATASVVAFAFIVYAIATAQLIHAYAFYDRWHQPFAVFASMPVAYAIIEGSGEVSRRLARLQVAAAGQRRLAGPVLSTVLVAVALGGTVEAGVDAHLREPYYHVLEDADWELFLWVARHPEEPSSLFLTHPWKAPILTALSGGEPYSFLAPGAPPVNGDDYVTYLAEGGLEATWLVERDISLVVDAPRPAGEEFVELRPNIFALRPDLASELAALRAAARGN